jgi:cell division septal protein FtsQ
MNKVLKIIGIAFGVCAILALLGFVGSIRSSALCEEVQIVNHTEYDAQLVSNETVLTAIELVEKPVEGRPMNLVDTRSIEKGVVSLPYVKAATAYKTIDKKVVVEIEEREIIARLIDENGTSAFLDSEG